jgi:16S rRNA (uracil1498-N3)-methyltransferase
MRDIRIYCPAELAVNAAVLLDANAAHHVRTVLRMQVGDMIILFNGDGTDYVGTVANITKQSVTVQLHDSTARVTKSPLYTHLVQGICKGEKMDFVIQKATELGVNEITPVFTQYGNVKLDAKRTAKKLLHWQKIAVGACEQSGRSDMTQINAPLPFAQWLSQCDETAVILDPGASQSLGQVNVTESVSILIGPEGGFSLAEIEQANQAGIPSVLLGPRVLRSETAGLAALTLAQSLWGDLRTDR